ncbi:MAG: phage head morphogenesis protein [Firmicutes bacterium]|nr:phage head morphogenesis protein [Bacillota bacterium]
MSKFESDLRRLLDKLNKESATRENKLARDLLKTYEEARKELYIRFLEAQGGKDTLKLQHLEGTIRAIERQIKHYTNLSAKARQDAIDEAFLLGQDGAARMLAAGGGGISYSKITATAGVGVINRGMVEALIGDVPKLAGRVSDHILFRIRDELTRGAVMGESIPKIANRILGTGLTQEGLKKPFPSIRARAKTIARTEIIKASDAGYEDLATKAQEAIGEEIYNAWITAGDDRVSTVCRALAAGADPRFNSIKGYPGVYHQERGPRPVIHTHPNCRCRRIPFLISWAESGALNLEELKGRDQSFISSKNAHIPEEKLTKYALNKEHKGSGRDKAIAFEQALGYNKDNYQDLIGNIRKNISRYPAEFKGKGKFGDRYQVIMDITGPNGKTAKVLTGWLVEDNGKARLVTAHVDKRK